MYHSHEKCATRIIKKTGHNIIFLKKKFLTKTFTCNFDDKLKINICITENNKEKQMLSHIFHLRTNDVTVAPRNTWIIIPKTDNTTHHKIRLKTMQLCA
jgi:hypothetical protein